MKRPTVTKWDNLANTKGLLFFAQAIDEMLFHHTIDSYKAPALNTVTRAIELKHLIGEHEIGKIKEGTLKHAIDEFNWSVSSDMVLNPEHNSIFQRYCDAFKELSKKPKDLIALISAIIEELDKLYFPTLEKKITSAISGHDYNLLYSLTQTLIVYLEYQGYSRSYIYFANRNYFFNKNEEPKIITDNAQIKGFLDGFKQNEREWKVVIRGVQAFSTFVPFADHFGVKISSEPPEMIDKGYKTRSFTGNGKKYPYFITLDKISNIEPFSAKALAVDAINLLTAGFNYHDHKTELKVSEHTCVLDIGTGKQYFLKDDRKPMLCRGRATESELRANIESTINILKGNHLKDHMGFVRGLNYHKSALDSNNFENQLLNLWAAIEGLLPPPSDDSDRIVHYLNNMLPVLSLTYGFRLFGYVHECLINTSKEIYDLIDSISPDINFQHKTILILLCDEFITHRNNLFELLHENPLLKNRCINLHAQFSESKLAVETLRQHKKKVGWHIQRIYTTRNQIMHCADSQMYIKTLVENIHTYLDTLMNSITLVAENATCQLTVASILKIVCINERNYLKNLEAVDVKCNADNYKNIVLGFPNPLLQ